MFNLKRPIWDLLGIFIVSLVVVEAAASKEKAFFSNFWPPVLMILVWIVGFFIAFIIWFLFNQPPKVATYYDQCDARSVSVIYQIRLFIGKTTLNESDFGANLIIDFLDTKKKIVGHIVIPIKDLLTNSFPLQIAKVAHSKMFMFSLARSRPLPPFEYVRIYHNSPTRNSRLILLVMFIKDPIDQTTTIPISSNIKSIADGLGEEEQMFPVAAITPHDSIHEITYTRTNLVEFVVYVYMFTNWSLIFSLIIPMKPSALETFQDGIYNGLAGSFLGWIFTLLFIAIYLALRNSLSSYPSNTLGLIKVIYFVGVCLISTSVGIMAALYASKFDVEHTKRWDVSLLISESLLAFVWGPIYFVVPRIMKLMKSKEQPVQDDDDYSKSLFSVQSHKEHELSKDLTDPKKVKKTLSSASIQSTGSSYYDQLMTGGNIPRVRSISQYGALFTQDPNPR